MKFVEGTAIVTGGNSGIGLETTRNLLLNGVNVSEKLQAFSKIRFVTSIQLYCLQ